MALDVSRLTTAADARNYLENVRKRGRDDLVPEAFRRLCEIEGSGNHDDPAPLVVDFWKAIAAAEQVLREERGKTIRLSRTRQKIARVGVKQTVEDLTLSKTPSDGFVILTGASLGDLTAEYLVLKHREHFSAEAVSAARKRLDDAGVACPTEA